MSIWACTRAIHDNFAIYIEFRTRYKQGIKVDTFSWKGKYTDINYLRRQTGATVTGTIEIDINVSTGKETSAKLQTFTKPRA